MTLKKLSFGKFSLKNNSITKLSIALLAAGAIAFGTFTAVAGARHSPEHRIERMKKELNLTDAQAAQVKTVFEKNKDQFKSDRESLKNAADHSDAKKAAFQKMRADRQAVNAQILPILNSDQQEKYQQMIAKHEHHHAEEQENSGQK
ncbi:MAG TPA: hypothetical protein VGM92_00400 [Candidatus Kapabacteria bacterium]|jgi:Spy/CpxP family protein refolding chaperone